MSVFETEKLIDAIANGFIGLKDIDLHKIAAELATLDAKDKKELFLALSGLILKVVGMAAEYKAVIRLILSLIK